MNRVFSSKIQYLESALEFQVQNINKKDSL